MMTAQNGQFSADAINNSGPPTLDYRTLLALILEWLVIVSAVLICLRFQSIWVWTAGIVVIATRQHALLALYHDSVHGLLARDIKLNDFLINTFAGVPLLMPVELFRPLHFHHHRALGSDHDPEKTILFARQHWRHSPLGLAKLLRQLLGDLFFLNSIRTIKAWQEKAEPAAINKGTYLSVLVWLTVIAALGSIASTALLKILALWVIPAFTVTNLIQKLRSYAEHGGPTGHTNPGHRWTYSWNSGWFGRLTIWPYNINHHREHHTKPTVPWHRLPDQAADESGVIPGSKLISILLKP